MDAQNDTLVIDSPDCLKSLEVKDGKARVGAYAIRFSGPDQKDLQQEYFTASTDFGPNNGNGAVTMFNHGRPMAKGLEYLADRTFSAVKALKDDIGIWIETVLNEYDEYEKAILDLVNRGMLKWSSGTAAHLMLKNADGEITRWHPIEFSYTPTPAEPRLPAITALKSVEIPADTAAEIAKSFSHTKSTADTKGEEKNQKTDASVPVVDVVPGPSVDSRVTVTMDEKDLAAKTAELEAASQAKLESREKEISEMHEIGDQINDRELARKFIKDGKSLNDFRAHVLTNVLKAKPVTTDANIGMSKKEVGQYSLLRAIYQMATKGRLEGLELEAHEAAVKQYGRSVESQAFLVPDDVRFNRRTMKAQNVTTATAGGFLVETEMGPMIETLRNRPVVVQAGATTMSGLVGDVALPRHVSGATAYWVAETGALTDSQSVFGQKKLTPKRLGATIPFSTQFLAQSSIDAENFIRDDATRVLAIELDRAALAGTGAAGEPLGVELDPDINATVTYSGAAEWADVVEHETGIAVDNADIGSMAFILSCAAVGKWKTKLKDSVAGAGYLIEGMNSGNGTAGTANGYPVYRTNQTFSTANQSHFGVWSQLILAFWAGQEVIVDPFALKKSGQVEITFNQLCDVLVRQPLAFNISTDSAAA